jgi:hypothetical protein
VDGFTRAIALEPEGAHGYYGRAVAYLALGRSDVAAADLEAYLRLAPAAEDAVLVRARLDRLRAPQAVVISPPPPAANTDPAPRATDAAPPATARPRRTTPAPARVLVEGLVLPGLGQHETGRTLLGVGVLAAVGGAVYFALHEEVDTRQHQAVDPFGNPYSYEVRVRHRPDLGLGIQIAGGIALAAALESFLYAMRQPEQVAAAAPAYVAVERSGDAVRVGLRFSVGGR